MRHTLKATQRLFRLSALLVFFSVYFMTQSASALPSGFVYLSDLTPLITVDLRYFKTCNFMNTQVEGYHANRAIMTHKAAMALLAAEKSLNEKGYTLVIYDAYRPKKAVSHFVRWSETDEAEAQDVFYPHVEKTALFRLGYVGKVSSHTRGSTVDVSILKMGAQLHEPRALPKRFPDNEVYLYLEDGTVDMGTAFDFFDPLSWPTNKDISPTAQKNRMILQNAMVQAGFSPFDTEWWHFTLKDEPFPNTYFDFDIE